MNVYLFWALVGVGAGLFCALLDEGRRMSSDRRIMIQLSSLIVGYVLTSVIFYHCSEPDGGSWLLGLIVQIASSEITFRLLRPHLAILDPDRKKPAAPIGSKADQPKNKLTVVLAIQLFCSEILTRLFGR